ncbi:response regulator [Mariprofundus erugo]|uniref:Response regulator n=1 Tax=Mariprofundus erugo TaxID=2528639 RepID=A0A5R9GUF7_9PROT|nr:response regulator [Mariprofundus erugo]TLS69148.1 response regulator [Mariprofundus erugo]TLS74009.1 response regulator [Mariprofundus erugo]
MSIKVLIIDDEDSVQSILTAFLNRYVSNRGMQCEIVTMGDPVQSLFELTTSGSQYQLVLLDVRIPKLSGDEIYSSIEQVNPDILGRIMFITGYPEDLYERFPGKRFNVLQKPFRFESFSNKLDELLNR